MTQLTPKVTKNQNFEPYNITRQMLDRASRVDMAFLGPGSSLKYFFHEIAQRLLEKDMFCGFTFSELEHQGFMETFCTHQLHTRDQCQNYRIAATKWCAQLD